MRDLGCGHRVVLDLGGANAVLGQEVVWSQPHSPHPKRRSRTRLPTWWPPRHTRTTATTSLRSPRASGTLRTPASGCRFTRNNTGRLTLVRPRGGAITPPLGASQESVSSAAMKVSTFGTARSGGRPGGAPIPWRRRWHLLRVRRASPRQGVMAGSTSPVTVLPLPASYQPTSGLQHDLLHACLNAVSRVVEGAWCGSNPSLTRKRPRQTGQTPVILPLRSKSALPSSGRPPVPVQLPAGTLTIRKANPTDRDRAEARLRARRGDVGLGGAARTGSVTKASSWRRASRRR